jgi:hypothetical protein
VDKTALMDAVQGPASFIDFAAIIAWSALSCRYIIAYPAICGAATSQAVSGAHSRTISSDHNRDPASAIP